MRGLPPGERGRDGLNHLPAAAGLNRRPMEPASRVPIELLLEHRGWVRAVARALVADANVADDVEQDAWLAALRHPPRHADALRGWLARLVRHRAANARRGDARREVREASHGDARRSTDPADAFARIEAHERVVRAVLALAEPYRTTVVLRFYDELTGPQIAERTGVALETVRTRLKRAMALLRERLREDDKDASWSRALVPLVGGGGGAVMQAGAKAAFIAAGVLLFAGIAVWKWPTADVAQLPPPPAPSIPSVANAAPVPAPVAPAAPPTTAAVFGEVWWRSPERPAAGVTVRLTAPGADDRTVTVDASGKFRLDGLAPGTRGAVRVAAEQCVAEVVAVPPLLPNESRFAGVLWLTPALSADVVVTSIDGKPLPGAHVAAYQPPATYRHWAPPHVMWFDEASASATWRDARDASASATTDAEGRAILRGLVEGNCTFAADAAGFVRETRVEAVAAVRATTVRLALVRGVDVTGRVEDAKGAAIQGLVVWEFSGQRLDPNVSDTAPRATTDADGTFTLHGISEGLTTLWVARPGCVPVPVLDTRVPASSPVRIVLGGAALEGTVRDATTGAPVAAVRVRALGARFAWFDAVTDASGAYVLPFFTDRAFVNDLRVEGRTIVTGGIPDRAAVLGSDLDIHGGRRVHRDLTVRTQTDLRGRVTHAGGPVRGAHAVATALTGGDACRLETWTDGDGRYEFAGLAGLFVLVRAEAAGLAQPGYPHTDAFTCLRAAKGPSTCSVVVPAAGGATLDIDLVDGVDLTGRVTDEGGRPVEGAEVVLEEQATRSGPDGAFAFHGVELAACGFVSARKEGYVDAIVGLDPQPLNVRMRTAPLVRGVVRASDGVVDGAWVEYAGKYAVQKTAGVAPPIDWSLALRASVGADGAFRFAPPVAFSRIVVRARGEGRGPSAVVDVVLDGPKGPDEVVLDLSPTSTLRGRVVSADGAPVAGAKLELDRAKIDGWDEEGRPFVRRTDVVSAADGSFEIAAVAAGTHHVLVVADGFLGVIADVDVSPEHEAEIRLAPAGEIRGVVARSDGQPPGRVAISFFPKGAAEWSQPYWHASVQQDGSFRCAALPPGEYFAIVSPWSRVASFQPKRFDGLASGTTDARFVIDAGRALSGRVVGGDGAPVVGANIWIRHATDPPNRMSASTESGADGHFEVAGLTQDRYTAEVRPPEAKRGTGFVLDKRYLPARFPDLAVGSVSLELRLPLGEEIEGTLVDASGAPLAGRTIVPRLLVAADPDALQDGERPGTLTDATGRFVVTGLAPGRYRLEDQASTTMARTPLVGGEDVTAGARGLRVSLPATATISGRIVDEKDAPFAGVGVVARSASGAMLGTNSLADGTFEIRGVPGFGTFSVEAKVNQRAPMRAVDVAPGATGVTIRVVRGLPASGRLLDAAGKPVTPATLVFRTEHGEIETSAYADGDGRFAVSNLLPGTYRVEQMTSKDGAFVYVPWGTIQGGDEGVDLRRSE